MHPWKNPLASVSAETFYNASIHPGLKSALQILYKTRIMKVDITNAVRVPKGWGYEDIIVNCDQYCGKILHFEAGKRLSMHFHKDKKESWYVASGKFRMILIDTTDATRHEWVLEKGQTITITQCLPHQLICLETGDIYEFSTHHEDCDSYRIERGDVIASNS